MSPRSTIPSVLLPSPGPDDRGYKEFKKPNNIQVSMSKNFNPFVTDDEAQ
jgi:hypothetical protein